MTIILGKSTIDALENGRTGELGYAKLTRILVALGPELRLATAASRRPTLDELIEERYADHAGRHVSVRGNERAKTLSHRIRRISDELAEVAKEIVA